MYQELELRGFVYRDLDQPSTNNDRLSTTAVRKALNVGYTAVALTTKCFTRTLNITAVDDQATYDYPQDIFEVRTVSWETTASNLRKTSVAALTYEDATWRSDAKGTPTRWYITNARRLGLYVPPEVTSEDIIVEGFIVPYAMSISTVVRSSDISTVTTSDVHNLAVGEDIVVSGVTDATFDTSSSPVASVPTNKTFTYANTGSDTSTTSGKVYYVGGTPHLIATTDVPELPGVYQMALVHHAVWTIATGLFADDSEAAVKAQTAKAEFEVLVAALARG